MLSLPVGGIADYLAAKPFLQYLYTPFARLHTSAATASTLVMRPTLRNKADALGHLYIDAKAALAPKPIIRDGYDDLEHL